MENVERGGSNPHFRSRYAQLGAVLDEVRPKFARNGIAILQHAVNGEGSNIGIVTRLAHSSGQWIESSLYVAPAKFDAQGAGSVITYLRRYALMALVGIGPDDDDGEAAVGRPQQPEPGTRRLALVPPSPIPPEEVIALPPASEESPEATAARQRVRMLIGKYDHLIKTAGDRDTLAAVLADGESELAEIAAAGKKGRDAVQALHRKYAARIAHFGNGAA